MKKFVGRILCGIAVALVCIIALWVGISNKMIENYNKQFLQYDKKSSYWHPSYVSDVEGLINSVIKNNKSDRKLTIIYQNTNYTSIDELKQLLSKLSTDKNYSMEIKYDKKYDYIESITLSTYVNQEVRNFLRNIVQYEGKQQSGNSVKTLINSAQVKVITGEEIKVIITYISDTNQTTVNVSADNSQEIINLKKEIKSSKTYQVEIQSYSDTCNIIITSND